MHTTSSRHALVIGCGIAGPAAAMALQRAGIDATIYEAHDRPADSVGSFLNLASNGLDALRAIDADGPVLREGFPTPRMVLWSGTGKRLGVVPNGGTLPDGTTSITIKRGLLHRALRVEAIRRGIRIEGGKRLVDVDHGRNGVAARFDDGSEARGEVLIGVDGLHSRTRRIIDAAAPTPRYTGLLSIGGFARNAQVAPTPDEYHMIFGKRAFFGYTARPSGELYWFANVARRDEPTPRELSAIPPDAWKRELHDLFADDRGPAAMILEGTGDDLGAYPIDDMPAVPTWHKGRSPSSATRRMRRHRTRVRARPLQSRTPSCSQGAFATFPGPRPPSRPTRRCAARASRRSWPTPRASAAPRRPVPSHGGSATW